MVSLLTTTDLVVLKPYTRHKPCCSIRRTLPRLEGTSMPRTPAPALTAAATVPKNPRTLTRSIGVGGGTLLTLSCVTPASSLFVLVPPLFADLGTGTALAIALAVLLCVGIACCYAELGTLAVALFVMQAFSTAVYLAEEMRAPRRTVVRTVFWTLGISALVILVPVVAITLAVPDSAALAGVDLGAMVTGWSNSGLGVAI